MLFRSLQALGCEGKELIAYGYLASMVASQCVKKTTTGCDGKPELLHLLDRTGKQLPVKNHCRFCYNTIYNTSPLSFLGLEKEVLRLNPLVLRLQFTIETRADADNILNAYISRLKQNSPSVGRQSGVDGEDAVNPIRDFTRGHFKRGIE